MRNLFSESLQTALVTAKRKYYYFPWPLLHTWAVSGKVATNRPGRRKRFSRTPLVGSAPARGSCQATAQILPEIRTAAPCQHWGRSQAPGFPMQPCAHTSLHLPSLAPVRMADRGTWEQSSAPQCSDALVGQSCGETVWRGKERREDLTKHLQITPANCAFPGAHNNSTQNPSCLRAPPGCLQRARFSGRRGWGVANNYTELEGSDLKRIFSEREINTFNSEQEHSAHNPFTSWQGRTAEACYEACLNNSIFIFWISN